MRNIEFTFALKTDDKKKKIAVIIKLVLALCMFAYFFTVKNMYVVKNDYFMKRIIFISGLFVAAVILSLVDIKLNEKIDRAISIILAIVAPFTAYFLSEFLVNEPICAKPVTNIADKEPIWIGISLGIIVLTWVILMCITNSMRIAAVLVNFIYAIFSTVICVVYELRGVPMMAPDVLTAKTAANVMGEYKIQLTFKEYTALFLCLLFFYVFLKLKKVKLCKKLWTRGIAIVVTAVVTVVFTQTIVLSDYMKDNGISVRMFKPMESYQKYGAVVTFARSINYARVKKPENYSIDRVNKIIQKYETLDSGSKDTSTKVKPNIITIVNETFSDIKVLGDFSTSEDYMPFYHSMKENCIKGYTYASIVGGQTANTEFEFLTANSLGFLSPDVTAFQLYIHGDLPSIVRNLQKNGYQGNKAFHPYRAYNYNRPNVYPFLGFEDFLDMEDLPADAKKVRRYISDDADIDKVISEFEEAKKKSDDPFYMYNLTIQNHSPYDRDHSNFKQSIELEKSKYDVQAKRYLNLIKYSDDSLKKIVQYFEQNDEPTIILFVGDHQPRLTDSFLDKITNGQFKNWNEEQMMKRYQVPFVIWANYDIKEEFIDKTSMNYLQSILTQTAGVKMSGYQKFLNEIRKEIPSITAHGYWGKNGKFYEVEDKKSPYYDIIEEYRTLQYNMMFDSKNRVNSFFDVQ